MRYSIGVSKMWQAKDKSPNLHNKNKTFNFDPLYFWGPFRYTVIQWKALRYGKDDSRGLSCGSTLNIYLGVLKICNLLDKWSFVDSQSSSILYMVSNLLHERNSTKT